MFAVLFHFSKIIWLKCSKQTFFFLLLILLFGVCANRDAVLSLNTKIKPSNSCWNNEIDRVDIVWNGKFNNKKTKCKQNRIGCCSMRIKKWRSSQTEFVACFVPICREKKPGRGYFFSLFYSFSISQNKKRKIQFIPLKRTHSFTPAATITIVAYELFTQNTQNFNSLTKFFYCARSFARSHKQTKLN